MTSLWLLTLFPKVSSTGYATNQAVHARTTTGSLVCPLTTLSHESRAIHGDDASEFNPHRWDKGPAASTPGPGYLPFGFGRWACPGRVLAVCGMALLGNSYLAALRPMSNFLFFLENRN